MTFKCFVFDILSNFKFLLLLRYVNFRVMSESDSGVEAGSDTESLGEMSVGSSAPSEDEQALPQVNDLIAFIN